MDSISEEAVDFQNSSKKDNFCQVGETFCENVAPKGWDKPTYFDASMSDFERDMKDSLLGKVMDNFERTIMNETKKFDKMKRETDESQALIDKDLNSQHIPSTLRNNGADLDVLWRRVHNMIVEASSEDEVSSKKACMKTLTPEVYQMILSHGIGAWLSTLNRDHYEKLSQKIYSETSQWISKIWRFRCSSSFFHGRLHEGLLSVCKVAMASHYSKYISEGYNALYSRPPVIYLNSSVDPLLIDVLRANLGLPSDCISLVPNNFELGGDESMDTVALEQLILGDISAGKMPLLICAYAGSPNTGSMDQLNTIHQLCNDHRIWLHFEGCRLSQLALLHVPAKVNTVSSKVKSVTLDLGGWLGIPNVPYVTLVMTKVSEQYLNAIGFGDGHFHQNRTRMDIFPLWLSLQLIGHDGIVRKVERHAEQNLSIVKNLEKIENIRLISRQSKKAKKSENKGDSKNTMGLRGLMDTVLTFLLDGYQVPFVVVFRYHPIGLVKVDEVTQHDARNGGDETFIKKPRFIKPEAEESQIYLNSLNHWLADNLISEFPQLNIRLVNLPLEGVCLRLCLRESDIGHDVSDKLLKTFYDSVSQHVTVMTATVEQRRLFRETLESRSQLAHVDLPSWAGLGCVLYIPDFCRTDLLDISSEGVVDITSSTFLKLLSVPRYLNEISKINKVLVDELRKDDEAFSLGLYHFSAVREMNGRDEEDVGSEEEQMETLVCIRFGLITGTTVVSQLVDLVIHKGEQVEASTRNLEKLSKLVRDGIDKVTEELAKEHEQKLRQDGLLRQVPYLDSIINWWYPPGKHQIKGRSLNLSSGEIQSTDDTYKYKMQLQAGPQSIFSFSGDQ